MTRRVVITGIGVVSAIGVTRERFWRACLAGRSGARRLDSPWVTDTGLATRIGAPVDGFDATSYGIPPKDARLLDRVSQFGVVAALEALADAKLGLEPDPDRPDAMRIAQVDTARVATIIGSGIGGLSTVEESHGVWRDTRSKSGVKRYALPMLIPNAPAGQIAIATGARGECKALSTACAAGTMALGDAFRILCSGEADVAIAGGAEAIVSDHDSYGLMGFDRLRTMSRRNDEPQRASRPFDRDRDGFVLGEGAAVLLLETEEHARARGVPHYARILGYATNCDARSMMQLDESGRSIVALIESALRSADLAKSDVEAVSAHATSTPQNDRTEAKALRALFGQRADAIPVTGLKSMTGHAIAASGPLETAAAALGLQDGVVAPTINHDTPDPECDVDVVANEPRRHAARACLKLSYGFGGHNACLVLARD